jgi:hypothetical protein
MAEYSEGGQGSPLTAAPRSQSVNGYVVLAEGLDVFTAGAIASGGKMNPSGNLSFTKTTLVG